jgi:DNA repair protein RecO (recombination protein O)
MLTKDTGICIHSLDYSETSQIVTLLAKATGKINTIAKGSKRPKSSFSGPIEMLSAGKIVFAAPAGGKLATLTEFEEQFAFTSFGNNLFALNCALFSAELLNKLTDDYDPHPELFDSFLQFLQNINKIQKTSGERQAAMALLILFQLSLLKEVGIQPVLSHCANCKTSNEQEATSGELYFSSSANGLVCRDCETSFPDKICLTRAAANCLSNLKQIANADETTLNEIEKILVYHFTELLCKPPKMAKHILKM